MGELITLEQLRDMRAKRLRMSKKKYELTSEIRVLWDGTTLHRIRHTQTGKLGGWVEGEHNLSHEGAAWISGDAKVHGRARVSGDAQVYGRAHVFGDAHVYGQARVYDQARVSGDAQVYGQAWVFGRAWIFEDARVLDSARVYGEAHVGGGAVVSKPNQVVNITNLPYNLTVTPDYITIGCQVRTAEEWLGVSIDEAVKLGLEARHYDLMRSLVLTLANYVQN